jgi:F-type H+-transporting ATPase subunit delta
MRQPKVAQRYAKALFDISLETNQLEKVKEDIESIRTVNNAELNAVLMSPVINGDKKISIFKAVFEGRISPLTISFFNLLFKKNRELALEEILVAFEGFYRKFHNVEIMEITTATPVSDEVEGYIKNSLKKTGKFENITFEVRSKVDESIIGGFIAQIGDTIFDASIKHDLQVIKKQFIINMFEPQI